MNFCDTVEVCDATVDKFETFRKSNMFVQKLIVGISLGVVHVHGLFLSEQQSKEENSPRKRAR